MSTSEQDRVQQALKDHAEGNAAAETLGYDPLTGRMFVTNPHDPDRGSKKFTNEDFGFTCDMEAACHDCGHR